MCSSDLYGIDPQRVTCRVNVESVPEPVDRAIPVGLILNELLSNAFEHAFSDGRCGRVALTGTKGSGRIEFVVEDDGVGMPEETESTRPKTLGFEIVRILSRQLRGEFEVQGSNGTCCRLWYPQQGANLATSAVSGG